MPLHRTPPHCRSSTSIRVRYLTSTRDPTNETAGAADADGERFFFHRPATRCWRKGGGAARAAGTGVWRPSGKETLVVSPRCKRPVGTKRTLVFCPRRGRGGARTDWAMHEYRLLPAGLHLHGCSAAAATNAPPPTNVSANPGWLTRP